jgi:hypothetical protein
MTAPAPSQTASLGLRPGDVDLSDPGTFLAGVPHEYFRVLREQDPVHWQEECELPVFLPGPGYWALTRYEDVSAPASAGWPARSRSRWTPRTVRSCAT